MTTEVAPPRPRAVLVGVPAERRDRRGARGLARRARAAGEDPRLRRGRPGDAEAPRARRRGGARRGQARRAGHLDRRARRRRAPAARPARSKDDDPEDDDDEDGDEAPARAAPRADVVVVDHELSPMQSEPRVGHRRRGARSHRRDPRDLPPPRDEPRGAAPGRDRAAQVPRAAPARARRRRRPRSAAASAAKGAGESHARARSPADPRPDRRAASDELARDRGRAGRSAAARRSEQPTVALVGYTNAGKSSLMRALTGSEVYVADKLFATLDTTVRALHPDDRAARSSCPTRSASSRSCRTISSRRSARRSTRPLEASSLAPRRRRRAIRRSRTSSR